MLRLIIALGISFMLFPSVENHKSERTEPVIITPEINTPSLSTYDTLSAVNSVINDFSNFCRRNEEACITGSIIMTKAQNVAQKSIESLIKEAEPNEMAEKTNDNTSLAQ